MNLTKSSASGQIWLLVLATLACLAPFLAKPFNIDDPLFIWTARHIQTDPANFYGFNVNWERRVMPMPVMMQNPPLSAYYMAAVASVLGWSETALHFGYIWMAVAVVIGTFFVARRFCAHPGWAAILTLVMPAFLVCSTSVMCDTTMLALWMWAIHFWLRGMERSSQTDFAVAAALIAACALTKYFGACLIPLLTLYTVLKQRRAGLWLLHLAAAVLVLAGYELYTRHLYGHGLFFDAASYATTYGAGDRPSKLLVGLAFGGGTLLAVPAALPLLWGRHGVTAGLCAAFIFVLALALHQKIGGFAVVKNGETNWPYIVQWAIFATGGLAILALAAADLWAKRDPDSLLLFSWVLGVFLFAWAINWTVAARNILPMAPAIGILMVRRMESAQRNMRLAWWPAGISLAVALCAAWGDYQSAGISRYAAGQLVGKLASQFKIITFEGHWGFQYYMEALGATAVDRRAARLAPDTAIVQPMENSQIFPLPKEHTAKWNELDVTPSAWVALMSVPAGAGYYSDHWGPAPFVFCAPQTEHYVVYVGH